MRSRRLAAAAALTVAAFALSGCSVLNTLGSAADEARMSSALDELEAELKTIPGITSVAAGMPIRGDLKFDVSVSMNSVDLTMENQRRAADAVTELFTTAPFSEQPRLWFSIDEGPEDQLTSRLEIEYAGLSKEVIVSELDYLDAFAAAAGQNSSMVIYPPEPENGVDTYTRYINIVEPTEPVDWDALRAVPDITQGGTSWTLGAVSSRGAIIPEKLENLAGEMNGPDEHLNWNAEEEYLALYVYSEKQSDDFESLPAWARAVELATYAQSDAERLDFLGTSLGEGANAYFGTCDDPKAAGIADEFAASLVRAGVAGAHPGVCMSKQQY